MSTAIGNNLSYDDFVKKLNDAGIKTTHLSKGEANFADYGNALSSDIKNMVMDSYDCQQDYELQSLIAGIYADRGSSVLQSNDFIKSCKSLGLEVNVQYQKTSYISDYKAGNFDNSVGNGAIAIYTISDGMGGEIVVADANGNAALESEELFMNQILGDINYEISATKGAGQQAASGAVNNNSNTTVTNPIPNDTSLTSTSLFKTEEDKEEKNEVKQDEYNELVEKYLEQGLDKFSATKRADNELHVHNMTYTGSMA